MYNSPIQYHEPLFRPPSEHRSMILQVTLGCSWNKCSFCEMYTSKQFHPRKLEDIVDEIKRSSEFYRGEIRRIFLADGDPLVLSTKRLLPILDAIKQYYPKINRISTYASPSNLNKKSPQELNELKSAGLDMVFVGIESGDDQVLECIQKGETFSSIVAGLNKAKEAQMKSSVMILNGVGGIALSEQHAINSAKVLNEIQPEYASILVLTLAKGLEHYLSRFKGDYQQLTQIELMQEVETFMQYIDLDQTIFRSDHASNYLVLKGVLNRDKQKFIDQIQFALNNPGQASLREEWQRGL